MFELRWHGRGGMGAVTAAELLAYAAVLEGKYGLAIPFFGAERRGAPVVAYNRIDNKRVRRRSIIRNPDAVVVFDNSLLKIIDVTSGLKEDGYLILNSSQDIAESYSDRFKVAYLDATGIALKIGLKLAGIPLVNMPMLGAVSKVTNIVSLSSLLTAVKLKWPNKAELNLMGVKAGYESVEVI